MVISRRSRAAQASKATDDSTQLSPSEEKKNLPMAKDNSDLSITENDPDLKEEKDSDESFEYKKDETVLCYHGPLLYEGKILKVEMWDAEKIAWYKKVKNRTTPKAPKDNSFNIPGVRYEIHYKGWKQRWDEWVTASRILKWTPANLALQDSLNGKTTNVNEGGSRKTANSAATATPKSNSTPKPATPGARSSRNGTKSSTPSAVDGSPPAVSSPAMAISKRKSVEVPELKEFKSKRLQAIRTNQSIADSPRPLTSETEFSTRSRSSTNQFNLREGTGETKENSPMHHEVDKSDSRVRNSELRNKRKIAPEPLAPNTLRAHETPQAPSVPIMDLVIPESLKVYLVDQWDFITRGLQLVPLPRVPSVRTILSDFRAFYIGKVLEEAKITCKTNKGTSLSTKEILKESNIMSAESNAPHMISDVEQPSKDPEYNINNISPSIQTQIDIIHEVLDGLALYFTKTLGTYLLYRFERPQYADLLSKYPRSRPSNDFVYSFESSESSKNSKSTYSSGSSQKKEVDSKHNSDLELLDIYGAEHLIRLFIHLPQLVSRSDLDLEGVRRIQEPLAELLNYLAFHQKDLFLDHYENAAPSYVNTVRLE